MKIRKIKKEIESVKQKHQKIKKDLGELKEIKKQIRHDKMINVHNITKKLEELIYSSATAERVKHAYQHAVHATKEEAESLDVAGYLTKNLDTISATRQGNFTTVTLVDQEGCHYTGVTKRNPTDKNNDIAGLMRALHIAVRYIFQQEKHVKGIIKHGEKEKESKPREEITKAGLAPKDKRPERTSTQTTTG